MINKYYLYYEFIFYKYKYIIIAIFFKYFEINEKYFFR